MELFGEIWDGLFDSLVLAFHVIEWGKLDEMCVDGLAGVGLVLAAAEIIGVDLEDVEFLLVEGAVVLVEDCCGTIYDGLL